MHFFRFPFRLHLVLLVLGLLIAPASVFHGTALAAQQEEEEEEHTELENNMDEISSSWRKVRKQVADAASNAETAALVAKMKQAATTSLELTPMRAEDVPEAERAEFIAGFRTEMKKFAVLLGKLEQALKENRNAEAEKLVADIGAHQKASHREYKRPDEK